MNEMDVGAKVVWRPDDELGVVTAANSGGRWRNLPIANDVIVTDMKALRARSARERKSAEAAGHTEIVRFEDLE
jgi:hypothetical protein